MSISQLERIIISISFGLLGFTKVLGLEFESEAFLRWGFPLGFMYFIGILEVAGAIGIWMRNLDAFSAACLTVLAVGALVIRLLFGEWGMAAATAALLVVTALFAWDQRRELFPR